MDQSRMLRLGQVAERLGVSVSTTRRLVKRGDLPACRIGYQLRVDREDLDSYVARARTAATAATAATASQQAA